MSRMKGKTALVTGASAGIGYAIVETLAKHGMNVIGCARNIESIEKLNGTLPQESGNITALKCDLSQEEDILQMFKTIEERHNYVDVLINNAARFDTADLITAETKVWRAMVDLNILGLSICAREAIRLMDLHGATEGHIVNINSDSGYDIQKDPQIHFYEATKHMVTALTEALYQEVKAKKDTKIRVSSVSPGCVDTRGLRVLCGTMESLNGFKMLDSKDVADAVLYVITAPVHVCVKELLILPTDQDL